MGLARKVVCILVISIAIKENVGAAPDNPNVLCCAPGGQCPRGQYCKE